VKVAYLLPTSGPAGIWAPACQAAATVAAAEINANGGILGEEVELLFGDSGLSEREATATLETLVEVEGAEAIVGAHTSNIRDAISRRLAGRLPYVYTAQYEGVPCGPSTVAIGSTDSELLAPGLHWLINEKKSERFFFVGNDYIWPRMALGSAKHLIKQYNRELVGQAFMPIGRLEHDDVLRQIAIARPDVVVLALVGNCSITFNRAFAKAGLDEGMLRFALVADETVVHGIGADGTNNLYTVSNYFADRRSRSNDRFLELYHNAFGMLAPPVSAGSIGCYEGLHVLAGLAREQAPTDSVILANVLRRSMPREAARHSLFGTPVGQHPQTHIAAADGLALRVIASITSH
jgi:ABC-type branched-subunit amino acid transport system substrate-binding protein